MPVYKLDTAGSDLANAISAPIRTAQRLYDICGGALTSADSVLITGEHRVELRMGSLGYGESKAARLSIGGVSKSTASFNGSVPLNPIDRASDFNVTDAWALNDLTYTPDVGSRTLTVLGDAPTVDSTGNPQGSGSANFTGDSALQSATSVITTQCFTIGFWVEFGDLTGAQAVCSQWAETSGRREFVIYKSGSSQRLTLRYSLDGTSAETDIAFGDAVVAGEWNFFAIVVRPLTVRTFQYNLGDLIAGGAATQSITDLAGSIFLDGEGFNVGSRLTGGGGVNWGITGSIDGVFVCDDALEQWEIEDACLRWVKGTDRNWTDTGGGVWTIPTLCTPPDTTTRSDFRLYDGDRDINTEGMEANAGAVTATDEYFMAADGLLTYFPDNDDPNAQSLDGTTAKIGSCINMLRLNAGQTSQFINLNNISVLKGASSNLRYSGTTAGLSEGHRINNVDSYLSNHGGIALTGWIGDFEVSEYLAWGNDHAGGYINRDASSDEPGAGPPVDIVVSRFILLNNRRQGWAFEEGHGHVLSVGLITGTRTDGVFSRGIQLGGADGDNTVEQVTFYDNTGASVSTGDGDIAFLNSTDPAANYIIRNNVHVGQSLYMMNGNFQPDMVLQNNIYGFVGGAANRWISTDYTDADKAAWETASGEVDSIFTTNEIVVNYSEGDFNLTDSSEARGAGVTSSATIDLNGRSYSVPYDLGAYIFFTGSPTLSTPYTQVNIVRGASGSFELSSNWTGASTFDISQLPNWCVQSGTTGTINYTNACWGTEQSDVCIGDGLFDLQVQAVDSTGLLKSEANVYMRISFT